MVINKTNMSEIKASWKNEVPRKIEGRVVFYRFIAGLLGGFGGTLIMLVVIFLATSVFQGIFSGAAEIHPLFTFVVLAMAFLATSVGNLLGCLLIYLADKGKYRNLTTILTQVFLVNIIIFIFCLPLYLVIQGAEFQSLSFIVGVQIFISSMVSALVMEVVSRSSHLLVNLYGVSLGIIATLTILLVLMLVKKGDQSRAILILLALPLIWGGIGFFGAVTEMVYAWFYSIYGVDYLGKPEKYEKSDQLEKLE